MNCLNGEAFLASAVNSILNQTYQNWELIFVDNASDDATPAILKSFLLDRRIKYFVNSEKKTLGESRNIALSKCSGAFITFLDADDVWEPKKIASQIIIMRNNPDVAFIYSNFFIISSKHKKNSRFRVPIFWKAKPSGYIFGALLKKYSVNLQTVMLRSSVVSRLNLKFDTSLHLAEEFHFFMRILLGHRAFFQVTPTASYRIHPNQDSAKKLHLYPEENKYVLSELRELAEDSGTDYSKEFAYLAAKIKYFEAKVSLRRGDVQGARLKMAEAGMASMELKLLSIIFVVSPRIFVLLHKLFNRPI